MIISTRELSVCFSILREERVSHPEDESCVNLDLGDRIFHPWRLKVPHFIENGLKSEYPVPEGLKFKNFNCEKHDQHLNIRKMA